MNYSQIAVVDWLGLLWVPVTLRAHMCTFLRRFGWAIQNWLLISRAKVIIGLMFTKPKWLKKISIVVQASSSRAARSQTIVLRFSKNGIFATKTGKPCQMKDLGIPMHQVLLIRLTFRVAFRAVLKTYCVL